MLVGCGLPHGLAGPPRPARGQRSTYMNVLALPARSLTNGCRSCRTRVANASGSNLKAVPEVPSQCLHGYKVPHGPNCPRAPSLRANSSHCLVPLVKWTDSQTRPSYCTPLPLHCASRELRIRLRAPIVLRIDNEHHSPPSHCRPQPISAPQHHAPPAPARRRRPASLQQSRPLSPTSSTACAPRWYTSTAAATKRWTKCRAQRHGLRTAAWPTPRRSSTTKSATVAIVDRYALPQARPVPVGPLARYTI
jgi:hypothetical protein